MNKNVEDQSNQILVRYKGQYEWRNLEEFDDGKDSGYNYAMDGHIPVEALHLNELNADPLVNGWQDTDNFDLRGALDELCYRRDNWSDSFTAGAIAGINDYWQAIKRNHRNR